MTGNGDFTAYELLVEDYLRLTEFIHPDDRNLSSFSHRTFELLLRTCTEFENLSKQLLINFKHPKALSDPDNLKIFDFENLYKDSKFLSQRLEAEVGLLFWTPKAKYIQPFSSWVQGKPLSWYQAYNNAKHNRDASFHQSNFETLTLALAGLFLVHFQSSGWKFFQPYSSSISAGSDGGGGYRGQGSIFSVKGPGAGC